MILLAVLLGMLTGVNPSGVASGDQASAPAASTPEAAGITSAPGVQEAAVEVKLDIDTAGTVDDCTVVSTTAPAAMNEKVCQIFREKAKFTPKLDENGKLVRTSLTKRVRFKLED